MSVSMQSSNQLMNYALPCSMAGAVCALSGIEGIEILVNGPSSCTGFTTGLVDGCHPLRERNAARFSRLAQKGHPRIPCSEITDADVILGIGNKLIQSVETLAAKRSCECIAVVNSCSLSLIGEDAANILKNQPLSGKIVYLESTGCGKSFAKGFSDAMIQLIGQVTGPRTVRRDPVINILGVPVTQYSWKHDVREIRRLMAMAGIQVNTILAAQASLEEVRQLLAAPLNVVIHPAYGLEIADFMKRRFDQPYIAPSMMPIGFDANRKLMSDVLGFFNLSTTAALDDEERQCRKEALLALSHSQRSDMLRGLPVAIFGEYDFVAGLSFFLRDYLGCHPVLLGIAGCEEVNCEDIKTLYTDGYDDVAIVLSPDGDQAAAAIRKTQPVIIFGSAFEEYLMAQMDYCPKFFVQTSTPGYNHANLVHRPYIGYAGALTFIDAVLDCKLTNRYPYSYAGSDAHD